MPDQTRIDSINEIINRKMATAGLGSRAIYLRSTKAMGVAYVVDERDYEVIGEIEDAATRELIQSAIDQWEAEQASTPSANIQESSSRQKLLDVILGKKRWRGIIAGVVLLGITAFCSCALFYVFLFGSSADQIEDWQAVVDTFMLAMSEKEVDRAYVLFSTEFQKEVPASEIETFLSGSMFALFDDYKQLEITEWEATVNLEGRFVEIGADVMYVDDYQGRLDAVLTREDDSWKLLSFNVTVPPGKIERYETQRNQ